MRDNKRFIINLHLSLAALLALIVIAFASASAFATDAPAGLYCMVGSEKIPVRDVDGADYLFLPSEAASEKISLRTVKNGKETFYLLADSEGTLHEALDIDSVTADENGVRKVEVYSQTVSDADLSERVCDINVMCGEGIGTVYLHSSDPVKKGRSYVDASKENKAQGTVHVTDNEGAVMYDGKLEQIRPRGSSSFKYFEKKAYQIKLEDKASLIDGTKKGKTWVLIAAAADYLKMNDYLGKELARYAGEQYAAAETPVNLYYDGEYRGVYLLSEKNQIKSNRIDITDMEEYYEEQDKSYGDNVNTKEVFNRYGGKIMYQKGLTGPEEMGGYLLELTGVDGDENNRFTLNSGIDVNIKSPELSSKASVAYISEYMQEFEDAIRAVDSEGNHTGRNPYTGLYYYDYCDLDSLVTEYMIQTILSNNDGFYRSCYFYKDKGGKLYCGPVWDTDLILGMGWNHYVVPDQDVLTGSWAADLVKIPGFRSELRKAWRSKYSRLMSSMMGKGFSIPSIYDYAETLKPSVNMDYVLWPGKYKLASPKAGYTGKTDSDLDTAYVKAGRKSKFVSWDSSMSYDDILAAKADWLSAHKNYLDGYFNEKKEGHVHQLGEVTASDGKTHTRACVTCGAEVKEDCVHLATPKNLNHHTAESRCAVCGSSVRVDTKCVYKTIENSAATAASPKRVVKQCSLCHQTIVKESTLSKGDVFSKGNFKYRVTTKDKYVRLISSKNVKSAVIPATVKFSGVIYKVRSIGAGAFRNKTKMTSLKIGKNVRTIGKNAFRGCKKLKTVKGSSGVRTIGAMAFYGDRRLTKVASLKSCKSIGSKAFYGCKKLKSIGSSKKGVAALNKKVKIGKKAFTKSGIRKKRKIL